MSSLCTGGSCCTLECLSVTTLSHEIICCGRCHMLRYSGRCRLHTLSSLASFEGLSSWLSAMLWALMAFDVYQVMLGLTLLNRGCPEGSLYDGLGHSEVGLCLAFLGWLGWVWSASVAYAMIIISVMAVPFIGRKINIIRSSSVCLRAVGVFINKTFWCLWF